jgi:hypothetical protein
MHICRKILWLLIFLLIILFTSAHAMMVLFSITPFDDREKISEFGQSLKYICFTFLGDYDFLNSWPDNRWLDMGRIIFSFFTSIVTLNILSMYMHLQSSLLLVVSLLNPFFFDSCTCK